MRGVRLLTCLAILLVMMGAAASLQSALAQEAAQSAQQGDVAAGAVQGNVPGGSLGNSSDSELWRAIRQGQKFGVSIPDQQAAVMVQSEGDLWRVIRNGPLSFWGAVVMVGTFWLLVIFFLIRGRIKIDHGFSGQTIQRFGLFERALHWMVAVSFIILAFTGMNLLWGKHVVMPIIGKEAFATITMWGKYAHNFLSFPFMLGIALMFVIWVRHNIPNRHDLIWLSKAGGLLTKGVHPPSKKFNAGQKFIFWSVILGGLMLSLTGIAMLFPFQVGLWAWTFGILQSIGFNVPDPASVTPMMDMQLSTLWHSAMALLLMAIVLGHIYIGSVGMEGALDAMGSGQVDINWAREHHNLWVAEVEADQGAAKPQPQPAE